MVETAAIKIVKLFFLFASMKVRTEEICDRYFMKHCAEAATLRPRWKWHHDGAHRIELRARA
jgi:hypothetical protein